MSEVLTIVAYDPAWPGAFSSESCKIAAVLGDLVVRIDHNGSTSVPGLGAKPIIDIQVSVRELTPIERYAARLAELGYVHVPHPDDSFCAFFHRPAGWPHIYHVHIVHSGGEEERRTLAFRDYLRKHPEVAREYEELKRQLASQYSTASFDSQQAYSEAKTEFITRVTEQAFADGFPLDR